MQMLERGKLSIHNRLLEDKIVDSIQERRDAFENKYAHDLELKFLIEARAVRQFGLWVAAETGLPNNEAQLYADRLVRHNLREPGLQDVFNMARKDLAPDTYSDHMIDVKLAECLADAEAQAHSNAA